MLELKKTHRLVKAPQISARLLADYMAGSERAKRAILVGCKFQPVARVIQHDHAKQTLTKFFCAENPEISDLTAAAEKLRARMADSDFDRAVLDHNADYLDRAAKVVHLMQLPDDADILAPGKAANIQIGAVKVTVDFQFRLRRVTKTNKVLTGAGVTRYAKGKVLKEEAGLWQSAFTLGYLRLTEIEEEVTPDGKLCVTIDAHSGACHYAPGNSVNRFKDMEAACIGIAERWENVKPPESAVL